MYLLVDFWWIRLRKQFRVRRTALQYNLSDILIKFAEIQQEWNFFPPIFLSGRKCSIRMLMNIYIYIYVYPRVELLFFLKKKVEKCERSFFLTIFIKRDATHRITNRC